jgi:hypothetical protein
MWLYIDGGTKAREKFRKAQEEADRYNARIIHVPTGCIDPRAPRRQFRAEVQPNGEIIKKEI